MKVTCPACFKGTKFYKITQYDIEKTPHEHNMFKCTECGIELLWDTLYGLISNKREEASELMIIAKKVADKLYDKHTDTRVLQIYRILKEYNNLATQNKEVQDE